MSKTWDRQLWLRAGVANCRQQKVSDSVGMKDIRGKADARIVGNMEQSI